MWIEVRKDLRNVFCFQMFQDLIDDFLKIYIDLLMIFAFCGCRSFTPAQVPDRWNRIACTWTQSPVWSNRTLVEVAWGTLPWHCHGMSWSSWSSWSSWRGDEGICRSQVAQDQEHLKHQPWCLPFPKRCGRVAILFYFPIFFCFICSAKDPWDLSDFVGTHPIMAEGFFQLQLALRG